MIGYYPCNDYGPLPDIPMPKTDLVDYKDWLTGEKIWFAAKLADRDMKHNLGASIGSVMAKEMILNGSNSFSVEIRQYEFMIKSTIVND